MDVPVFQVTTSAGQITAARFFYEPEDFSTGIAHVVTNAPGLFPNPAENTAWLTVPEGVTGLVQVLDAAGRVALPEVLITSQATVRLDLSTLAAGSYLVQVLGDTPWTGRLVVRP